MRNQLIAVAGVVGLIGAAAGGTAAAGQGAKPTRPAAVAARAGYLFPGLASPGYGTASTPARGETTATQVSGPVYSYNIVTFGLHTEIGAINKYGVLAGNVSSSTTNKVFTVNKDTKTKPKYFTFPYPKASLNAQVSGIDNAGDVVGSYSNAAGVFHGFEFTAKGVFSEFTAPKAGTLKGEGTEINGISDGGILVGSYVTTSKHADGFIDTDGHFASYSEPSAGSGVGQGTAVEFDHNGEYGGLYVGKLGAARGWYVVGGKLHTVNDTVAGSPAKGEGTQLTGVDDSGRLYGLESPEKGTTESFSYVLGQGFTPIVDPHQVTKATVPNSGTVVLGVNIYGVVAGFYSDNSKGDTNGFFGLPETPR